MIVKVVCGDIIDEIETGKYHVVVHGCNCEGVMGAGVAKVLNDYTLGALLKVDLEDEDTGSNKFGHFTTTAFNGIQFYNAYTQLRYNRKGQETKQVSWTAVTEALHFIAGEIDTDYDDMRLLLPPIGCGLAGGAVEDFAAVIKSIDFGCATVTVVANDQSMFDELSDAMQG